MERSLSSQPPTSSSPIPSLCGSSSSRLLRLNPVSSSFNLFIDATWSSNRAEGLAKAVSVLALGLGVIALAASSSLRTPEEARALAKSAMAELLVGGVFLLIEIFSDQTITSFINNQAPRFASFSPGAELRSWPFSPAHSCLALAALSLKVSGKAALPATIA